MGQSSGKLGGGIKEGSMVSECANRECSRKFLYFRDGRLFVWPAARNRPACPERPVCHAWLCGECCQRLTVVRAKDESITVVPLAANSPSQEKPHPQIAGHQP